MRLADKRVGIKAKFSGAKIYWVMIRYLGLKEKTYHAQGCVMVFSAILLHTNF